MDSSTLFHSAMLMKRAIEAIDSYVLAHTSQTCPGCRNVCCINRHGHYDHEDLIYINALGLKQPPSKSGVRDEDPCRFLSASGCTIERPLRPFRCTWYFCDSLLESMERGAAKPYRQFIKDFQEIIELKRKMADAFSSDKGNAGIFTLIKRSE